ncbi:golgin subfamily A member 5-like [Pollicipes pollicipes]|uniref:golgin subfamily A member 5-like n=1 Tax=Pollicipes pollicipes TaxID=41117 RepID=UPI0018851878|nr:golgin subfamily A member 5-like [Pollicipes pollicipes]
MSWLSGLASKTESLLNSLDQGAAVALQKQKTNYNGVNSKQSYRFDAERASPMPVAPVARPSPSGPPRTPSHGSGLGTPPARRPARLDQDEQLIAFLNDSTPVKPRRRRRPVTWTLPLTAGRLPQSSSHSRQSSVSSVVSVGNFLSVASGLEPGTDDGLTRADYGRVENGAHPEPDQVRMLQKEIANLNREMAQLVQRAKLGEKDCTKLKYQLTTSGSQLAETERQCRHLQQREADLQESLTAKSSSDTSGLQSGTIQGLQDRLQEAETRTRQEQQALATAQQEHERAGSVGGDTSRGVTCHAAAELAEYKLKAQRILQSKDQLIAGLKDGSRGGDGGDLLNAELEQVRSERELAQTEVQKLAARVQQLRDELHQTEAAAADEAQAAADALREAETRETADRRLRQELEQELEQAGQEMRFLREEMTRQKTQALTRLQERDDEIEKLRRQITSKHVASSTEVELETRLRSLTENLIQKQTNIESLSTQNKSLAVQLERAQVQIEQLEGCAPRPERAPTPWDGSVARRVKRAYSTLDACSVRMGVFLKRYPIARIFVLGYMCLLHLWVMIVLFTYTPEIHGDDFHRPSSHPLP